MTQQLVYRVCCAVGSLVPTGRDWLLSCMGLFCYVGGDDISSLRNSLDITFEGRRQCTLHVMSKSKLISLSVSSGVLVKYSPDYGLLDSLSIGTVSHGKRLGMRGVSDTIESLTSMFYSLVPFVQRDRPPRTLIAATQANQAISLPFTGQVNTATPC